MDDIQIVINKLIYHSTSGYRMARDFWSFPPVAFSAGLIVSGCVRVSLRIKQRDY